MAVDAARAKSLFLAASDLSDPVERAAYLERECGGDAELRDRVEGLLRANDAAPLPSAEVEDGTSAHVPDRQPETDDYRDPSARVGSVIAGKYKLIEAIGEGGMGSVYMAQQTEPVKRVVAVKVIKAGMDSKAVLARFEAERQALAMMDHPNIAKVLDAGATERGRPFFVMELVRGQPITQFCDQRKLTPRQRLELFLPVCQAIQHAHQKGVIHRDIKPSNVLVALYDDRPAPKVIDFGVAKAAGQSLTDRTLMTGFGAVVGTAEYMSPEQANPNNMDIDTRSDVYSLGVLLYELLTGATPVDRKSLGKAALLEILRIVREVEAPRPSVKLSTVDTLPSVAANRGTEPAKLAKLLRGELDWVVMKALEKDRARRYDSANGLARDVQRYLADEVVEARPPSRGYRVGKFVRRHRGAVLATALVVLALVVGMAGVVWQWREAVDQRSQAQAARADAETYARIAQMQRKIALDAVGKMVTAVRNELVKKPDTQDVLKKVLEIAQSSLDNIAQNPLVDVSLNDTTRAAAHDATARLYRDLGDTPTALAEFNKAADIYQAILDKAADGPDKEVVKKNLVITLISIGQTSLRTGSQADARGYYERAAQLIGQLDNKTAADYSKTLISLYSSLGVVTIDTKPREAREDYLEALRVAEKMAARETAETGRPTDETRDALKRMYLLVGGVEGRLRDAKSREQYYGHALTIANEMLGARPEDDGRKRSLASAHERIGDSHLRTNSPADAAEEFTTASALYQAIAAADPKNVDAQADLARILYSQGLAAARIGNKDAAAAFFQGSLDIRKSRFNLNTESYAQRDLMMSLARVGSHREAAAMAESVRTKLPKDPVALVDIAGCYAVCSADLSAAGAENDAHDRYVIKALESLKQAIDAGYGDKVNLETEPDLDGIRNQAEFKTLLNQAPEP